MVGAFYVAFGAVALGLASAFTGLVPEDQWIRRAGRGLIGLSLPWLAAVGVLYWLGLRLWRWDPVRTGWRPVSRTLRGVGTGVLWGVGLAGAVLLLGTLGGARIAAHPSVGDPYLAVAIPVAVGVALAALAEELLFRGFPLARLADATGVVPASVLLATVFAVAHLGNPDTSPLGVVNIGIAALLLSAVFFSPGGIAAAWGLHLGWNAGLVLGSDAPVSGLRFALPALEYSPGSHGWVTGGRFGPEGGIAATIVLTGALGWWVRQARGTKETR